MNQKGFLTIISLIAVIALILAMAVIILKITVFRDINKEGQSPSPESSEIPQPTNILKLPQQVEKDIKSIEKKYQNME